MFHQVLCGPEVKPRVDCVIVLARQFSNEQRGKGQGGRTFMYYALESCRWLKSAVFMTKLRALLLREAYE